MKKYQKGSVAIWVILLIIAVIILGVVYYFVTNKQETTNLGNSNTTASLDNWQVYESTKNSFSFNYPTTWQIKTDSDSSVRIVDSTQTDGPAYSEQSRDYFEVVMVQSACKEQEWLDEIGGVWWGRACISNGHSMAQLTFIATSDKSKTLEEKIESTFRFTK